MAEKKDEVRPQRAKPGVHVKSGLLHFPCQSCGAKLKVGLVHVGKHLRCPKCKREVTVPAPPTEPPPKATASPPPVVPPRPKSRPEPAPPSPPRAKPVPPPIIEAIAVSSPPPPPPTAVIAINTSTSPQRSPASASSPSARRGQAYSNPRSFRYKMMALIWFGPLMLNLPTLFSGDFLMFNCFTLVWTLFGFYPSLFLSPYVTATMITALRCPGCGEVIPCVDHWNCGCGFHDHRQTNVLMSGCRACGRRASHINCPRCDVSIMI